MSLATLAAAVFVAPQPADAATVPGPTTTGVPSGVTLKKWVGDMTIKTPGAVIDGYDVHGNILVLAPNVTISRTLIRGTTAKVPQDLLRALDPISYGLKVIDVTIKPDTPTVYQRIGIRLSSSNQLVQRVDVSGVVDGIRINGKGIRVEDSWLHDFKHYSWDPEHPDGSHDDAIQVEGGSGIRIVDNSISGARNAAVMIAQGRAAVSDLWVNGNFVDDGGCTINIAKKKMPYMTGLQVNNNRFGRGLGYPRCPLKYVKEESDLRPVNNVWDDTGAAIPLPR